MYSERPTTRALLSGQLSPDVSLLCRLHPLPSMAVGLMREHRQTIEPVIECDVPHKRIPREQNSRSSYHQSLDGQPLSSLQRCRIHLLSATIKPTPRPKPRTENIHHESTLKPRAHTNGDHIKSPVPCDKPMKSRQRREVGIESCKTRRGAKC